MELSDDPNFRRMVEASQRALDGPGGEEILDRMLEGQLSVEDGLVALLVMSGDYERKPGM